MSIESAAPPKPPGRWIGLLALSLGALAFAAPLFAGRAAFVVLGLVILLMGVVQNATGFSLREPIVSGLSFARGGTSIVTGLLLLAMPKLTFAALAIFLGLSWFVNGASTILATLRRRNDPDAIWLILDGLVNVILGVAIAAQWPLQGILSVGWFVGLRYISAGWGAFLGAMPTTDKADTSEGLHPDESLGLAPHPYLAEVCKDVERDEAIRRRSDRSWRWLLLVIFFAIHAARMDAEWNFVGMLSPFGAVLGDAALAILLGYGIVAPVSKGWRFATRGFERRAWNDVLAAKDAGTTPGWRGRWMQWWLERRLCAAVRTRQTQGSATAAMGWGLQAGLPIVAILIAVTPLWGINWVFNSETWVTGGWEMWAEQRTDDWRVAMVDAVRADYGDAGQSPDFLRIAPEGVPEKGDFSFIVIGDTGEGDASQHILRDQLWTLGQKPEVKFLVVSSDVIYPSGSMKDYEPKFYLPFKGFRKPIYALPGNHDWYDALEAFTANFYEPKAARAAMRSRREKDRGLTATTEKRIDDMIAEASRLRDYYDIRAAAQKATYFEMHTGVFSLIVVDTGILRRIDDDQMTWLEAALGRAKGNFTMVLIGHPFYAAGRYQGAHDEDFAKIHDLLAKHDVAVTMGGDTHDFEFYKEDRKDGVAAKSMLHFVNGGGGAYLSIGTALSWPKHPDAAESGFYPAAGPLKSALDERMPMWKQPMWWWVRDLHAWPSTPEQFAAAFDYDHAPFFQSFMEVRVEPSTGHVRFWLYGPNGRLRWRDLHLQGGRVPGGAEQNDLVEFAIPMRN